MVSQSIVSYLVADHARLHTLLNRAMEKPELDREAFADFRRGLLRHIAIEEKLLLPAAQEARNGRPLPIAERLRLDHGAIAALLVPSPTPAIVGTLRHILAGHDRIEEDADGLYASCDALLGDRARRLVAAMETYPEVRASPHNDGPGVMPAVERALARAGYALIQPT